MSEDSENKFLMIHMIMKKKRQRTMTPFSLADWVKPGNKIEIKKYDGSILSLHHWDDSWPKKEFLTFIIVTIQKLKNYK